jgi:hypothetical protein
MSFLVSEHEQNCAYNNLQLLSSRSEIWMTLALKSIAPCWKNASTSLFLILGDILRQRPFRAHIDSPCRYSHTNCEDMTVESHYVAGCLEMYIYRSGTGPAASPYTISISLNQVLGSLPLSSFWRRKEFHFALMGNRAFLKSKRWVCKKLWT